MLQSAFSVIVGVGLRVELPASMTTNWGGWLPWREEKTAPSVLSAASTKLNVPFPVTTEVTLYSTQVFVLIAAFVIKRCRLCAPGDYSR